MFRHTANGVAAPAERPMRRASLTLVIVALALAACALAAPAAMAVGSYTGGPMDGEFPVFIANDHTMSMLRFEAPAIAGTITPALLPSTTYYVRVVLSPSETLADTTNRGFTWNSATERWVQEREDWSLLHTITTDASGVYKPYATWWFFKFGDVRRSGPYYLFVLLKPVAGGTDDVVANLAPPAVTVMDPAGAIADAQPGFWVHNGVATPMESERRADAVSGIDMLALSRTEANGVDDDGNGFVDDEDYGPEGATGDFLMGVPTEKTFVVRLMQSTWPGNSSYLGSIADVDIAWAVADMTAPSKVTGITATPRVGEVTLNWSAAPVDDEVVSYRVYRWSPPTPLGGATQYTSQPQVIGATAGTSFVDEELMEGETYFYHVRAVDEATNRGPRSAAVSAAGGAGGSLTLKAAKTIVPYLGTTTLRVRLYDAYGLPVAGRSVNVQKSLDGVTWTTFATVASDGGTATTPKLSRAMRFRAKGIGAYSATVSPTVRVKPRVYLGVPVVPSVVYDDVGFVVYGTLKPRHAAGWNNAVKLYCYRLNADGVWVLKKTAWCKTIDYSTYSRYWVKLTVPSGGTWKLRAYAPEDARHAEIWSTSTYRLVR